MVDREETRSCQRISARCRLDAVWLDEHVRQSDNRYVRIATYLHQGSFIYLRARLLSSQMLPVKGPQAMAMPVEGPHTIVLSA